MSVIWESTCYKMLESKTFSFYTHCYSSHTKWKECLTSVFFLIFYYPIWSTRKAVFDREVTCKMQRLGSTWIIHTYGLGFGYYGDLAIWSISSWLSNPLECCGCLSTWWKRWEKAGRSSPFPPSLTGWQGAILLEKSAGKSVGLSLLLSALLRERAVGRESRHETFAAFKACESKWSPRH